MSPHLFSRDDLLTLGLAAVGDDVHIDRSVRFFGAEHIRIGNRVRIDCFALLSAGNGGIVIGDNIHLAAGCYLFGSGGAITLEDFAGLSARVAVYTASDDYTEGFLTNPTVPDEFRRVAAGPVVVGRHAIVGSGSVILPGVTLGFGASVGALSLVRTSVGECEIVTGNPTRKLPRLRDGVRLRELEARYAPTLTARGAS
jgi:acetyltransferase-like isoleucine patch superfamily enzyme